MKKPFVKVVGAVATALTLSGCMGQMATSGLVTKMNLQVVDNRFARAGLFMLLTPVYALTASVDYFVINSIEFWTGTNPINNKRALTRTPMDTLIKVTIADVEDAQLNQGIASATYEELDANTLEMHLTYENGEEVTVKGIKEGENVNFYINGEFVSSAPVAQLEDYVASR